MYKLLKTIKNEKYIKLQKIDFLRICVTQSVLHQKVAEAQKN